MDERIKEIVDIIVDVADIPEEDICADSNLIDDLDLSSMEIMSVISQIERKYSVKISEKDLISIATVKDIADLILDK